MFVVRVTTGALVSSVGAAGLLAALRVVIGAVEGFSLVQRTIVRGSLPHAGPHYMENSTRGNRYKRKTSPEPAKDVPQELSKCNSIVPL